MNILDKIVDQKKLEVAKLPARIIAAGDLRDAMLEHGERVVQSLIDWRGTDDSDYSAHVNPSGYAPRL